jgi:hypothetical protein
MRIILACVAAASLSGCLVPEKFSASLDFRPDGSYNYKYEGTAVHALAAAALKQGHQLKKSDEEGLAREAEKGSKIPGVKVDYLGSGKFKLVTDQHMQLGRSGAVMCIVSATKDPSGVITVSPPTLKADDRKKLAEMGIRVDGKVEIRLPSNAKVVSHNAQDTPGLFNKAYRWKIGSMEDQPSIKFKLD